MEVEEIVEKEECMVFKNGEKFRGKEFSVWAEKREMEGKERNRGKETWR